MADDILLDQNEEQEEDEQQNEQQSEQENEQEESQEQETKSWRDELLPDDLKDLPLFEKYESPQEAFKAFAEAQKLIGKKGVIPPDKDASDEEKKAFLKQLYEIMGDELPDNPESYKLPEVEDLPAELTPFDERIRKSITELGLKNGLSQKQLESNYKMAVEILKDTYNEAQKAKEEMLKQAETELRQAWGKAYNQKLALAKKFIQDADEFEKSFIEEFGNDPRFIRLLARKAELIGEDSLDKGGKPKFALTPEQAKQEIYKIKNDPNHPFNIEGHPERELAMQKMDELYRMAYPELAEETE